MRPRQILFANFALAASVAVTGCAGPMAKDGQASVPQRDNLAPMGYVDSPAGSHPPPRNTPSSHQNYNQNYNQDYGQGYSQGYGHNEIRNPFTADLSDLNPQRSLERDLNMLRESEQAQQHALEEMYSYPEPEPDAIRQEERKLEEIRQKIHVYDIALRNQRNAAPSRPGMGMEYQNASPSSFEDAYSRDRVQAMAAPKGFEFPPKTEVRLPMARPGAANPPVQQFQQQVMPDMGEEQERVIYDPRRDGDFGLFALQSGTPSTMPHSGQVSMTMPHSGQASMTMPDSDRVPMTMPSMEEPAPVERRTIIPHASIPPAQKYAPPTPGHKPFAGAPVGRPQFPPPQKKELPEGWEPPANLFSESKAPDEVQSRPGLFSADGMVEETSWPTRMPPAKNVIVSRPEFPTEAKKESAQAHPLRPAAPDAKAFRPEPAAQPQMPAKTPELEVRIIKASPEPAAPAAKTARPAGTVRPEPVDEVFVPDLFSSRR